MKDNYNKNYTTNTSYIALLLILISGIASPLLAQPTVQWATRVVSFSSQYETNFYAAKQVLGPPNAMKGYDSSPYSWAPKTENSNSSEYIHVEFGIPMRVRQFAIVESLNPGAVSRVLLYDTRGISHEVYKKTSFQPVYSIGRTFTKNIPQTNYKVVGMRVFLKTSAIKGRNQIDAIAISNTTNPIQPNVSALKYSEPVLPAENLGKLVNSRYSERLPIISPDGSALYFTRKFHPQNLGDENKDDIWVSAAYSDNTWSLAQNIGAPLNNELHNFVIAVSPDNNRLYLASAYKRFEKNGIAVTQRTRTGWSKPKTLKIKEMYNRSPFAGYHVSTNGRILLMAIERDDTYGDRDLYVSFRQRDGEYTEPMNLGHIINSVGMESSVFLAADNKTIYFSSNGRAGYGGLDMYVSRRLDDTWQNWSEPQNLGEFINTPGNDYNYTIPASGDYAYFSSDYKSYGQSDLFRIQLPKEARPEPVVILDNKPIADADEELDGEVDIAATDPKLQQELDDLEAKLQMLKEMNNKPVASNTPQTPSPPNRNSDDNKDNQDIATPTIPTSPTAPNSPTAKPKPVATVDPELERLKKQYNNHLNGKYDDGDNNNVPSSDGNKNDAPNFSASKDTDTKTTANQVQDDELDDLRKKMLRLQGKLPDEPQEPTAPASPPSNSSTVQPEPAINTDSLKEVLRDEMRLALRDEVKQELKTDMIGQVRDEVADEIRLDLQDSVKTAIEDDLRTSMTDDVRDELRDELKDDVQNNLKDELADQVRDEVVAELKKELESEVRAELRKEITNRLRKEIEAQIRKELEAKIREELADEYANLMDTDTANVTPPLAINDVEDEVLVVRMEVGEIIPMNNIFFDANKTTLKSASYDELGKVVDFLKMHPNLVVEVGGHTNSWCSDVFANELSAGRAEIVAAYLVRQGIAQKRIQYHGYGKTQPIADNRTVQGRKKNQRVEMKIIEILQ